jgi:plastocyanin
LTVDMLKAGRAVLTRTLLAAVLIAAPAAFGQSGGREYTVVMNNMDYGAMPSNLKVGDTIVWVNRDTVQHSATARDHSFDIRLNPGQSGRLVLSKAGKIPFICQFHPTMRGTLDVAAK